MKVESLLSAGREAQKSWINSRFPNYQELAYEDTCFALFYPFNENSLSDHGAYPDEAGTFDTLTEWLPEFGEAREGQIRNGAPFTDAEAKTLKKAIADNDPDGWVGVHGWKAGCDDGDVFLVALGHSQGQGGMSLDVPRVFRSRGDADAWVKQHEFYTWF